MKKIIFLIAFCLSTCAVNAQYLPWELPVKRGTWDYPVKPGTEEWKKFKSYQEMIEACQVPEGVLSSLSTEDLTDLCLRYPPLGFFRAFNNPNDGLNKLFRDFNGVRELFKKADVSNYLIQHYLKQIQTLSVLEDTRTDYEKGSILVSISELEGLLSRINRQEHGEENLKKVLQALVTGYEAMLKYPDYFQGSGLRMNFFARWQIMLKMDSSLSERLQQEVENVDPFSKELVEKSVNLMDEWSYQLIK